MNPFAYAQVRQSSDAEIQALEALCERLQGFGMEVSLEWVDGFLGALAVGPQIPDVDAWLQVMFDDAFERTFADPADHAQALRTLQTRLKILREQLDPEVLIDKPDAPRLFPLLMEWTDEDRRALVESGDATPEEAATLLTGFDWASGFFAATEAFPELLGGEDNTAEQDDTLSTLLDQVLVLMAPPDSDEYKAHLERYYPKAPPSRDALVAEACYAIQDLRVFWVDSAPKPSTRRVAVEPGRNDPCPCGSGKKYKKCHGAATA
jgi:uncharacterized protein